MIENKLSIASVAAETGISKEVLRKWEERYGFPVPARDAIGKRVYGADQVERLKAIKRLLDGGMRPSQVVPLEPAALEALLDESAKPGAPMPGSGDESAKAPIIAWLQERDPARLHDRLRSLFEQQGAGAFVMESMPRMTREVGLAWASGEIAVRDEHLYTETMQTLLRETLQAGTDPTLRPRVLLTTLPGELHTLGLLMVQAVLSGQGAYCISLGAQSPAGEIVLSAADYDIDIVCLSFSASYPTRTIYPALKELRAQLPTDVELWIGGSGADNLPKKPRGVKLVSSLGRIAAELESFRARYGVAQD